MAVGPVLVCGAQKSASTAVARWFGSSAMAYDTARETMSFEGRTHALRTLALQSRLASIRRRGRVPVIRRPELFHVPVLTRRASVAFPGALAVVVLRNPVERAESAWWHYRRMGVIDPGISLRDCVDVWAAGGSPVISQIVGYSVYSQRVRHIQQAFETRCIAYDEEAIRDPVSAFSAILEQLGPAFQVPRSLPSANTGEEIAARSAALPPRLSGSLTYRWDEAGHLTARSLGWRVASLLRVLAVRVGHVGDPDPGGVSDEDRAAVHAAVVHDLEPLEQLLGRPVPDGWRR